jgi:hypothetical protein
LSNDIWDQFPTHPSLRPGRPTLDDNTLAFVRNDLVHLLSVWWADIGWQLRHANSREEFCQAFEPLRGKNNDHLVASFLKVTPLTTTGNSVRFTRRSLARAVRHRYNVQDNCNAPVKDYIDAETAVTQARPEELGKVRRELLKRQLKLLVVRKELRSATELEQTLEKQLAEQQVAFAQEQLVRILREGRCARNPLRLANAMAGLPSLTARVSYQRCSRIKCTSWPNIDFQVFRKIESIWISRHRYHDLSIVDLYRQEISKLPRMSRRNKFPNFLRTRLAENFGSLKLAIETSLNSGIEVDRIPFVVTSHFDKNREAPTTALTRTLAATERID